MLSVREGSGSKSCPVHRYSERVFFYDFPQSYQADSQLITETRSQPLPRTLLSSLLPINLSRHAI